MWEIENMHVELWTLIMDLLKCSVIDEGWHGDLDIKKLLGHVIQEVFPSTMLMSWDKNVSLGWLIACYLAQETYKSLSPNLL